MKTYKYTAIKYEQNPQCPPNYAFTGISEDLIKICGVATKTENLLSNYQRNLETLTH